jgi:hypothetical protein
MVIMKNKVLLLFIGLFLCFTQLSAQFPNPYCNISFTSAVEPITLVNFGGINNSTGPLVNGTPALEDFTGTTGNVTAGQNYTMTVKGNTDGNFTTYIRVFIDWNQNNILNDAGEVYDIGTIANSTGVDAIQVSASIAVPTTALAGNTRMRVMKRYNGYSTGPCQTGAGYGQAEDYTLAVLVPPPCSGVPSAGTISPSSYNLCSGQTINLTSLGATTGPGITYQWQVSPTPGGPYFNVIGGTGATTTSYTSAPLASGTYYGILKAKCATGPDSSFSNEVTIVVNPTPTSSALNNGPVCLGQNINLTGNTDVGTTFSWTGPNSFTSTSQNPILTSVTPLMIGTYSFTAIAGTCTSSVATTVVNVNSTPLSVVATAVPPSVCANGSSQLTTNSFAPGLVNTYPFSTSTGATLNPMVGATQVIGTGDDDTPTAAPASIGFPFNYNGAYYTQYSVSPDGWILLGGATAAADYSNQVTDPTNIPKIYPYWDDVATGTTGNVKVLLTGTAPNRIFIIQWFVTVPRNTTGAANSTFQAWLYEADGKIEFRYGTMGAGAMSSSVGLTGGTSNFNCVTIASNTNNTVTSNDVNGGQPVSGRMYTFTLPPATNFAWTPTTFLSNPSIANPMANSMTTTTTYIVNASIASGCGLTDTVTVNVGSPLISSAITTNSPVCQNSNLIATANPSGGGAPYIYKWDYGTGQFTSPTATLTINSVPPGSYTLSSIVLDNCGDSTIQSTSITINPTPTAMASSNSPLCEGQTLNLTGATDIGTTFIWSGPSFSSAIQNPSIPATTAANSGTYSFSTVAGPCTSSVSTVVVAVNLNPSGVTASATPTSVCAGSPTDLQSSAVPNLLTNIFNENFNTGAPTWTRINNSTGGTPANAAWTNRPDGFVYAAGTPYHSNDNTQFVQTNSDAQGSGSVAATLLVSPSFSTVGMSNIAVDFYHYYRDINDNGDSAVVEASLDGVAWVVASAFTATTGSENSFTHPTVNLPAAFNNQANVYVRFRYKGTWDWYWSIDNVSVNGLSASYTYNWSSNPIGFTSTAQNPTGVVPPSTSDYTVTVSNSFGCTSTASTTVTVDNVVAYISPVNIMCNGANDGSFTLDSVRCGTLPFTYSVDGGGYGPIPNNLTPGTHAVTIQDFVGGFSSPMSINITEPSWVPDVPTVVPANANICVGDASAIFVIPGSGSITIPFDVAVSPIESASPGTLFATATMPALPAGSVITSASITYAGINSQGGSFNSEVRLGFNGSINDVGAIGTGAAAAGGVFTYTRPIAPGAINIAGGSINMLYWESFDDLVVPDAIFPTGTAVASIVINYSVNGMVSADSVNWYDAASGGTLLATNDSLEAVGTSVLPNTNTPGTYTFYAEGFYHGCTSATRTAITVNVGSYPIVNLGPDAAYCNNHILDAGNAGDTYLWNNGSTTQTINALDTALYFVDVTSPVGCTTRDSINLVINPLPTVYLGPDTVSCGSYLLDPGPQPGTSTFLWSDASTASTLFTTGSGDFDVTVTDINGCVNSDSVHVDVPPVTSTNIGPDTTLCTNDTGFLLNATQPGSNTYVWQDGSTGSSFFVNLPGTYWVTLTNFVGCPYTDTIVVTSVNPVQANIDVNFITTNSATLDAGSGFTSYVWSTSASTQVITVTTNGTYIVTTTDNNGCFTTDTVNIVFSLGLFNPDGSSSIMKLYPNPSEGVFNLSIDNLETSNLVAEVLDLNGKVVYNRVIGSVAGSVIEPFNLTDLRMGTYVLRLTANGKTSQLRFVIGR